MPFRSNIRLPAVVLLVVTLGALGWVVHTTRRLRDEARARFFEQYNRQQLLVAEQASRSIEGVFATFRRSLTLVAELFRDGDVTPESARRLPANLHTVYQTLADTPVIDVVVFDRRGNVVALVPDEPYEKKRAAARLDLSRPTLDKRIRQYGLRLPGD